MGNKNITEYFKTAKSYVTKQVKLPSRLMSAYNSRPETVKQMVRDSAVKQYRNYVDFLISKKHIARTLGYIVPFTVLTLLYEKFGWEMQSSKVVLSRAIPIIANSIGFDYIIEKYDNTVKKWTSKNKEPHLIKGSVDNLKSMVNLAVGNVAIAILHYKGFLNMEWYDALGLGMFSTLVAVPRSYLMNASKNLFYGYFNIPSSVKTSNKIQQRSLIYKKSRGTSIVLGSLALSVFLLTIPSYRLFDKKHVYDKEIEKSNSIVNTISIDKSVLPEATFKYSFFKSDSIDDIVSSANFHSLGTSN
jgi:hypothetical protein